MIQNTFYTGLRCVGGFIDPQIVSIWKTVIYCSKILRKERIEPWKKTPDNQQEVPTRICMGQGLW